MLKQHITHLILEMIGEDKQYTNFISNEHPTNEEINVYNQALQDIREKVPELTDTIVNMIVEKIRNEITDIYINADQREDRVELNDIEKTLDNLLKD